MGRLVIFTVDDLERLAEAVASAWADGADRDWSALAGTLDWTCMATAAHTVDTVLAPAFFLASRRTDSYPPGIWEPGPDPTPAQLVEDLRTATRLTAAVIRATPDDVRSIIWLRPAPEVRPPEDFAPRAGMELALHGHDVCAGLGITLNPPAEAIDRLRNHCVDWPYWSSGAPWRPPTLAGDPWHDLLVSSGRAAG